MSSTFGLGASSAPPPIPSNYPGLRGGRGMAYANWQSCVEVLRRLYGARDGGRRLSDSFRFLPDPILYPDYSRTIRQPESLDNVAIQLGNGSFEGPESFFRALHTICTNAKTYFDPDTDMWRDAKRLEDMILHDWRSLSYSGAIPVTPTTNLLPAYPRKRGRPPKDPAKILAQQQAAELAYRNSQAASSSANAVRPRPGFYTYDANVYAAQINHQPVNLNMAMNMNMTPPMPPPVVPPRQNSDYGSVEVERMRQGVQSQADQAVVAALDARMPKWSGPDTVLSGNPDLGGIPGNGWWGEGVPDYERDAGGESGWLSRMKGVVGALKGYKDASGTRLAEVFGGIPPVVAIPYLSFNAPLSFESISINVEAGRYRTLRDFDLDMSRLFEKARRFHANASTEYGRVLVLQRLYNALTAPYPLVIPSNGVPSPSTTLFASLPAGPGNARPVHEINQDLRAGVAEENAGFGVTTFRVGTKDRVFTDEARHKGMSYKVGDYVHLINPDDATKPIVGQVFKSFVPTKGYRTHHVTVCWYFYPEQTIHSPEQLFYDREVFKTGHFCDHPVEDIIERISVQFYVKAIRGRPLPPEYYPGWPIYVCNSRYNDKECVFVRIKNWNSCIPDELRQTQFMAVEPFERQIGLGVVNSPFLRGITGPGSFGEPKARGGVLEDEEEEGQRSGNGPTPPRRPSASYGYSGPAQPYTPTNYGQSPVRPGQGSITASVGQRPMGNLPNTPYRPGIPPQHSPAGSMGSSPARPPGSTEMTVREQLPSETVRLFERDARGNILWFSAPPLLPGAIKIPQQPDHSIEYLLHLTKRKKGDMTKPEPPSRRLVADDSDPTDEGRDNIAGEVEDSVAGDNTAWWAKDMTPDQIVASLAAVVETVQ
ncbi:hypothetical protein BD324DRAFT_612629 [Kockovaella imperatae]|uniref:Uncharacterized protein n=1 Tax=Kockovaella imperatae TaxID=4999 RepID=A0A1Y1UUR5_9TREE|nr:hypothetical protein BD324DRAFT_612629 [Kockovaella imperatae]ORX40945.1 hypothetical protein BD324DRAFT_612629 [Kockovaella imperatae]